MSLIAVLTGVALGGTLSDLVSSHRKEVSNLTEDNCVVSMNDWYDRLRALDANQEQVAEAASSGAKLASSLFDSRVQLQNQMAAIHKEGWLTPSCVTAIRRADLGTRYFADYLLQNDETVDQTEGYWMFSDPSFSGPKDLRSGDVLVTRATAISSAGIAHMGRVDGQFSHNVLVYQDDSGLLHTVEAYLEFGGLTQPVNTFLEHELGRIVVMRFVDPDLAALGAKRAYERVASGEPFDYDEDFQYADHSQLFCSEVAGWALGPMVGRPLDIPLEPSYFEVNKNRAMYEQLGIDVEITSAPMDLLTDPRFEIVAEWRHLPSIDDMRRHDAVVEQAMTWMEERRYRLSPGFADKVLVDVGLAVRRTPVVGRVVADRLHEHGDRQFLITSLALQNAALALDLQLKEDLAEHKPSGPLLYEELVARLNRLREADYSKYKEDPKGSVWHQWLHP